MDWSQIERDWPQYRLSAKRRWERLSEKELLQINGKRDELRAKIQQAYGIGTHEAEQQIVDWAYEQEEYTQQHGSVQSQSQTLR